MASRGEGGTQMGTVKAMAIISSSSSSGEDNLRGSLQFLQDSSTGVTYIKGRIAGITPGFHGLHIHSLGDTISPCCISTGPHFIPLTKDDEAPSHQNCHALNLGNIVAGPDGIAEISIADKHIPLTGPHSVLGHALVVHANADDLGRGGTEPGKTNGNGGLRVGFGIIMLQPSV